jgi:hypothetical protein
VSVNSAETVQSRIVSVIDRTQFVFNRFPVSTVVLAEGIKVMVTVSQLRIDKAEKNHRTFRKVTHMYSPLIDLRKVLWNAAVRPQVL